SRLCPGINMVNIKDSFGAEAKLSTKAGDLTIYRLAALREKGIGDVERLPFSIKVIIESALRNLDEFEVSSEDVARLAKWDPKVFDNFNVVPPETGIVHQVNLEYLAKVVVTRDGVAFPDTLVGTDSHTTMINGLGVVGWGVGGIEAEACMLGQPIYMVMPQ